MKVEFYRHSIEAGDIENVRKVLGSLFLTTGSEVKEFEESFAAKLSLGHAVGVTSCTAALHLCLIALGIGEGDEVITTPMTFCATSNSIMHAGATPVFIDVESGTANIDASLIEEKITSKTKAIIPVHLYGQMCDMRAIRKIADKHGLYVIEDAAHCIEGSRDGVGVGETADAACFSFYATKNITSGEGGAVATNNHALTERIRMLRQHGMDVNAADRYTGAYRHWDMHALGWKYNMDNIQAALLKGQLERIDAMLARRERIWTRYDDAFSRMANVTPPSCAPNVRHARHLYTLLVPHGSRDNILAALQERGVGVAVNYRPVHLLKYYRERFGYKEGDFPVAESIGASTISLPLYPKLTDAEADYVIASVRDTLYSLGLGEGK